MTHITIDFGGTNIKIGLVLNGAILAHSSMPSYSGQGIQGRLDDAERAVRKLLGEQGIRMEDCTGLGIAIPGIVNSAERQVLSIHEKYEDAIGYSFDGWVRERFAMPFAMENDARAALIGETAYGAAQGEKDVVMVIFGTGIGTAVMIDGQVLRGKHHQAGVLGGHLTTDRQGPLCNCGNRGCLEEFASHRALRPRAMESRAFKDSVLSAADEMGYLSVIEARLSGDGFAAAYMEELVSHWSAGIVNLIHAYDPDAVLLSGGLMKSAEAVLPLIEEEVHGRTWTPWGKVRFLVSSQPDASVLLGLSKLLDTKSN
ncbi:ROK family protein [Paenibacillus arenilitoris]|uniref:ROK family protein n=1 Tax=Paenibacillus arenilitoris TaxID=2772299 RepID=A0A927H8R0_9BACL|nr:ROK family protein [Paenibacillus arenilitoris]MBD2871832.1 ROK family protein [Paenibacillus arenilitoris]